MASYSDLETGKFYLVRQQEGEALELVCVLMQTQQCVLVRRYLPVTEDFFMQKSDSLDAIVEELDEATIETFNQIYTEEESLYEETDDFVFDDEEEEEE